MKIGNLEVYGVIYKITNKQNGKIYIGQTTKKNGFNGRYSYRGVGIERVYNHHRVHKEKKLYYNDHLLKSIKKYGFDSFAVDKIFDFAFSKEELDIKEKSYIRMYNSDLSKFGYNKDDGGSSFSFNEEVINKIIQDRMKTSNKVFVYDCEGVFLKEYCATGKCAECMNIPSTTLKRYIDNFRIYKDKYIFVNELEHNNFDIEKYKIKKEYIYKIDLDLNILNCFDTCAEAGRFDNISESSVNTVCSSKRSHANGFIYVKCKEDDDIIHMVERHILKYNSSKSKKRILEYEDNRLVRVWTSITTMYKELKNCNIVKELNKNGIYNFDNKIYKF